MNYIFDLRWNLDHSKNKIKLAYEPIDVTWFLKYHQMNEIISKTIKACL